MKNYVINPNICTSCDACKGVCSVGAITDEYVIDPAICIGCGQCKESCTAGAIECQEKFLTWNDFNNEYDGKTGFTKLTNDKSDDIKSTDIFIWGGEFLNNIFKLVTNQQETNLVEDLNKKMITELPPYPIQDTTFIFDEITLSKISDDNTSTVIKTIKNIDNTNIDDFNNYCTLGFEHTNELDSIEETLTGNKTPYTVSATKDAYVDATSTYTLTLHIKDSKSFENISNIYAGDYEEVYPVFCGVCVTESSINANTITITFHCSDVDINADIIDNNGIISTGHDYKIVGYICIDVKGCKIKDLANGSINTEESKTFKFLIAAYTPHIKVYRLSSSWEYDADGNGVDDDNFYQFPVGTLKNNLSKIKYCINVTTDIYDDTNTKYGVLNNFKKTNTGYYISTYQLKALPSFPNDVYLTTFLGTTDDNRVKITYPLNNLNQYQSLSTENSKISVDNKISTSQTYIPEPSITLCVDTNVDINELRDKGYTTMDTIITKTY